MYIFVEKVGNTVTFFQLKETRSRLNDLEKQTVVMEAQSQDNHAEYQFTEVGTYSIGIPTYLYLLTLFLLY